jgi:hypothetical protein
MAANPVETFSRLLFEFIVIVVGVLTAFGLQEFAQSVSDEKQKLRYLTSVRAELLENQEKVEKIIRSNRRQDSITSELILHLDNHKIFDTVLLERVLTYSYVTFKLGAYEALKNSGSYDKLDNTELTTTLNNLNSQAESTMEFQGKVENLNTELFVLKNNDALDPMTRKILSEKVYSIGYRNDLKQLQRFRRALTREFELIRDESSEMLLLLELELK